jgi:hypothetical protein
MAALHPIHQNLQNLMAQEMDRRTFLMVLGSMVLALVGVSRLLRHLEELSQAPKPVHQPLTQPRSGYGGSPYGK